MASGFRRSRFGRSGDGPMRGIVVALVVVGALAAAGAGGFFYLVGQADKLAPEPGQGEVAVEMKLRG